MKPIGHSTIESFDQGVGFSLRAYKKLGTDYICVDSAMGLLVDTVGTTTPLTSFDKTGITYFTATNAGWLPYLADKGMRFFYYLANRVRKQFRLDQDIPDDISFLMVSPHFCLTLSAVAFEFLSQRFTTVIVPRLIERRSLYPCHAWIFVGCDDFV